MEILLRWENSSITISHISTSFFLSISFSISSFGYKMIHTHTNLQSTNVSLKCESPSLQKEYLEAVLLSFGWAVFQNSFLRNFYFALLYIIKFIFFILFCLLLLLICDRHLSMSTHGLHHSILICVQFSWVMFSSLYKIYYWHYYFKL